MAIITFQEYLLYEEHKVIGKTTKKQAKNVLIKITPVLKQKQTLVLMVILTKEEKNYHSY